MAKVRTLVLGVMLQLSDGTQVECDFVPAGKGRPRKLRMAPDRTLRYREARLVSKVARAGRRAAERAARRAAGLAR